jgi:hypothetical protein
MTKQLGLAAIAIFLLGVSAPCLAAEDLGPQVKSDRKPTPEEQAQKAAREACRIDICDIIETRERLGPDVACDIGWTWRTDEIVEALAGRVDWVWGKITCQFELRLQRADLARAMSTPQATIKVAPHKVRCALEHEGEPYVTEIELSPTVTFENGKATEAKANWGDVSAPAAIYPGLYAATGLDNKTNFLGSELVHQVNKFIQKDCASVRGQLPGRRVN